MHSGQVGGPTKSASLDGSSAGNGCCKWGGRRERADGNQIKPQTAFDDKAGKCGAPFLGCCGFKGAVCGVGVLFVGGITTALLVYFLNE